MFRSFIVFLTILLPIIGKTQDTDFGAWYQYFGNQGFGTRWNWHNEFQYRNYNLIGDLEQLLFRTGIGYNLSEKNNNVLLGYAFVHSKPYVPGTEERIETNEHRIYQQFLTRQHFNRVYLTHRYRTEQRFIEDVYRFRFRYALQMAIPLNQPSLTKGAMYIALANEIFLHTDAPVFDRDRVSAVMGYALSNHIRVEAGYMIQFLQTHSRGQLQLTMINNTPFSVPLD